ncbi:hypothetical protein HELRODRAFT_173777 [Helobdella robusta]|uniref:Uncharacterized protein n=1 Tax=Helobdella robusta TaxID=6412 RepID=T1F779_HELRO|nr:hypothetical protein HELRODRAFT_173777 [Helobdella robusta]ESO03475.1 hypothetical protein HELRODRAFT_173777 [Helobdella robusta]
MGFYVRDHTDVVMLYMRIQPLTITLSPKSNVREGDSILVTCTLEVATGDQSQLNEMIVSNGYKEIGRNTRQPTSKTLKYNVIVQAKANNIDGPIFKCLWNFKGTKVWGTEGVFIKYSEEASITFSDSPDPNPNVKEQTTTNEEVTQDGENEKPKPALSKKRSIMIALACLFLLAFLSMGSFYLLQNKGITISQAFGLSSGSKEDQKTAQMPVGQHHSTGKHSKRTRKGQRPKLRRIKSVKSSKISYRGSTSRI